MAKRERNKRAARKARQERRQQLEEARLAQQDKKGFKKHQDSKHLSGQDRRAHEVASAEKASSHGGSGNANTKKTKAQKLSQKAAQMSNKKSKPAKKRSVFSKLKQYLSNVRQELKRVTWPTKKQLAILSVAVIVLLIVVGVAIWLIDSGSVAALIQYSNLRS